MSRVLIVDHCIADRSKTASLLRADDQYEIEFASDATKAMSQISTRCPDIVLTDHFHAQQDGLNLVARLRDEYPSLPVIMMTDPGDEETAFEALQCGAASYVPKRLVRRYLAATVRRVITVSRNQRGRAKLLGSMKESRSLFRLKSDLDVIPPLVEYLQECMSHMGLGDESERLRVSIALEEALSNAIHHGNLEVDSRLREQDEHAYHACIRARQRLSPYSAREVVVQVSMSADEATFSIRDEGPGFDVDALPDPTDKDHLENRAGRGILLMKSFMDEVSYNDVGNAVVMTKRRSH